MDRSFRSAWLCLLCGAMLSAAWFGPRPSGRDELLGSILDDPSSPPHPRPGATGDPAPWHDPIQGDGRTEAGASPAPRGGRRTEAPPASGLVRVHGRVRRGGRPAALFDLDFHAHAAWPDGDPLEWDFTDGESRYEVRLPAGRYVVTSADDEEWRTDLVVPGGRDELVLDIDLPPRFPVPD